MDFLISSASLLHEVLILRVNLTACGEQIHSLSRSKISFLPLPRVALPPLGIVEDASFVFEVDCFALGFGESRAGAVVCEPPRFELRVGRIVSFFADEGFLLLDFEAAFVGGGGEEGGSFSSSTGTSFSSAACASSSSSSTSEASFSASSADSSADSSSGTASFSTRPPSYSHSATPSNIS